MKPIKGIYLIERIGNEDPQDKRRYYVGMAVDIFDRWHQHCVNSSQFIDKAIQQYGVTNFSFRILEEVSLKTDRKTAESKWIKTYITEKGEDTLYNISETSNQNPTVLSRSIKNEIEALFEEEIGRSIYAISEEYDIPYANVIKIRRPLLKRHGLTYDKKAKNVVGINDGLTPPNWKGGEPTEKMKKEIEERLQSGQEIDKDLISKADLELYLKKIGKL